MIVLNMDHIKSAKFIKGVTNADPILQDGKPQIAIIGRSNVGKSSTINALTKQKGLARTSSFPGRTAQINLFLINDSFYLVDLPGYGFTRTSREEREDLQHLIHWYLLDSPYHQEKVILIIDANVGLTQDDKDMLFSLEEARKEIIVIANKVDKIKKSEYKKKFEKIESQVGMHKVIPYSAEKRIGQAELTRAVLE